MLIAMAVWDTEENERTWMTKATLESIERTVNLVRHRLIVSDNGSCQATQDLYEEMRSLLPFELLLNGENIGTAAAINRAWRHRQPGEYCVKMDNDVVIRQPDWADWVEDVFARDRKIGICGLKRKDVDECPWSNTPWYKSQVRMLPHEKGQRWLVIEEVQHVIGTCQGYSSALLDKIGYLMQPAVYGFDDALAAVRASVAGFKSAFLHGFEIDHIDPGTTRYTQWKLDQASLYMQRYRSMVQQYQTTGNVYYDGGFKD